jgi:hypothetical protein
MFLLHTFHLFILEFQAKGKIVVYNEEYHGYGETVQYRQFGAVEAAKVEGVASLIRSIAPFSIDSPHTGWQVIMSLSRTQENLFILTFGKLTIVNNNKSFLCSTNPMTVPAHCTTFPRALIYGGVLERLMGSRFKARNGISEPCPQEPYKDI